MSETNYCLKCKKKQVIKDWVDAVSKNGRKMRKGVCTVCNTKVSRFMKGGMQTSP